MKRWRIDGPRCLHLDGGDPDGVESSVRGRRPLWPSAAALSSCCWPSWRAAARLESSVLGWGGSVWVRRRKTAEANRPPKADRSIEGGRRGSRLAVDRELTALARWDSAWGQQARRPGARASAGRPAGPRYRSSSNVTTSPSGREEAGESSHRRAERRSGWLGGWRRRPISVFFGAGPRIRRAP